MPLCSHKLDCFFCPCAGNSTGLAAGAGAAAWVRANMMAIEVRLLLLNFHGTDYFL